MNMLRLFLSFPASLLAFVMVMAILSVGTYTLLEEDRVLAAAVFSYVTWIFTSLAAFACVVVGARVAPKDHAVTISYVFASIPVLIVLKDFLNGSPSILQEMVGSLIGTGAAWYYLARKRGAQTTAVAENPEYSSTTTPESEAPPSSAGSKQKQMFGYAALVAAAAFLIFELRQADQFNALAPNPPPK